MNIGTVRSAASRARARVLARADRVARSVNQEFPTIRLDRQFSGSRRVVIPEPRIVRQHVREHACRYRRTRVRNE